MLIFYCISQPCFFFFLITAVLPTQLTVNFNPLINYNMYVISNYKNQYMHLNKHGHIPTINFGKRYAGKFKENLKFKMQKILQ